MSRIRTRLALAFLFLALFALVYFATSLAAGPLSFLYRDVPFLDASRGVAQIGTLISAAILLVGALLISIGTLFQRVPLVRRVLYSLPLFFVGLTIIGVLMNLLKIGTTGMILPGITLAMGWVMVSAIFAILAVTIAAWRSDLPVQWVRAAMLILGAAAIPALIAGFGLGISLGIISTTQPQLRGFGPGGGGAPNAQGAPQRQTGQPNSGGQEQQPPQGQGNNQGGGQSNGQGGNFQGNGQGDGPGGGQGNNQGGPPPGGPGGPGGGFSPEAILRPFQIGGGIALVSLIIGLIMTGLGVTGVRNDPAFAPSANPATLDFRGQLGSAALALVILGIVLFVLMQLVPVSRSNPPVTQTVNWDSEQTHMLASRACMDCHSNETIYPWYSYVAPSSWLTTIDVNGARREFNLSEMDKLPAFRRQNLVNEMEMRVENGTMPPPDYLIMHPTARLTEQEKQQLIEGLQKSLAQ